MGACRGVECSSKSAGERILQGNVANPAPVLHNSLLLTSVVYSLEVKLEIFSTWESSGQELPCGIMSRSHETCSNILCRRR
jgi:hypothetical protein